MTDPHVQVPRFALIVVNYGSSLLLKQNLVGINVERVGGFIVVVDNYTTHEERSRVSTLADANNWEFLALDSNVGFGGGVNVGAKVALAHGAQSIISLNPDAAITSMGLRRLAEISYEDPDLMVAPTIRTSRGDIWFDGLWLFQESGRVASNRRPKQPRGRKVPWVTGACFAISREMWQKVRGFDDDYFLYWEDVDLSRRVVAHGGRVAVESSVSAIHDEGGTQGRTVDSRVKSEVYYFYNIRNRLIFAAKHLNRRTLWLWLFQTPLVSYEILLNGGRRQFVCSIAPWRAYTYGIISGIAHVWRLRPR